MDQGAWYVTKGESGEQSGPHVPADFRAALLSGEIRADDQIWCDGMAGWETAAPFLWFAEQGGAKAAEPDPALAPEPPRPAPNPPASPALGRIDVPEKAVYGKVLRRPISISEGDLADFAGVNAEPYLAFRQKLIDKSGRVWFSWSWPAYFVPLAWFAYRRLYGCIFAYLAFSVVFVGGLVFAPGLAPVLAVVGIGVSLAIAMSARKLVLVRADKAAELADALDLVAQKRAYLLAAEGGVSRLGGWVGGIMHAMIFAYSLTVALGKFSVNLPKGWLS